MHFTAVECFYVIPRILGYRKPSWLLKGMFLWRTWDPWAQLGQTGSAPPFPSARWGWNLPEASRSFTEDQHPLFSQPGGERGFQELPGAWLTRASLYPPLRRSWTRLLLSTIPTDRGDQSYPASDSAGCRGNSEWLHSSQTKLSRNESGVVRDELVIYALGEQSQCREEVGRRFPFPQ